MATVINGILSRKLPWGLVLLGVSIVVTVELLGIRSLALPWARISPSAPRSPSLWAE